MSFNTPSWDRPPCPKPPYLSNRRDITRCCPEDPCPTDLILSQRITWSGRLVIGSEEMGRPRGPAILSEVMDDGSLIGFH